jgi:hypothetical protein
MNNPAAVERAQLALDAYTFEGSLDEVIADLITDLGHYADKHGEGFADIVRVALDNLEYERSEEE